MRKYDYSPSLYLRDRDGILAEIAAFQRNCPRTAIDVHTGPKRLEAISREYAAQF